MALGAALLLGVALLVPVTSPRPAAIAWMLLLLAVLALVMRFRVGGLVIAALLLAGIHLRIDAIGIGHSDVLLVTERAIDVMRAGGNPYALGTPATMPGSPPFPYGPLALLWYVPAADAQLLEMVVAVSLLTLLGLRGRPIGLALFALAPPLLLTFSDGSNDHSAGLMLLVALLALRRSPELGVLALALAAAFKPYALAWLVPLVAWAGLGVVPMFVLMSVALWGPAVVLWGERTILDSIARAEDLHRFSYFSLGQAVEGLTGQRFPPELFNRLRLALGALVGLASLAWVRSYRGVVISGIFIYLATLYGGYWSSFAYFVAILPVVSWYLDEWLGLARARVVWPTDPVGRLTAAVDSRWPVLR